MVCISDGDEESKRPVPQVVTEDNIDSYTIQDVVLPLPGYHVVLPNYELRNDYETLLQKDELTLESFKHKVR